MIANNSIHTNPPLCITEEQLAEGFDIIDRALDIADQAVSELGRMATAAAIAQRAALTASRARSGGTPRRGPLVAGRRGPHRSSILVLWEGVKFLGGTPWRLPGLRPGHRSPLEPAVPLAVRERPPAAARLEHRPRRSLEPFQRGADRNVAPVPRSARRSTPGARRSSGSPLGDAASGLGARDGRSSTRGSLERAFVPYVIASQTIPIVALAPVIVVAFGRRA